MGDYLLYTTVREMRRRDGIVPQASSAGLELPEYAWQMPELATEGPNGPFGRHNTSIYAFNRRTDCLQEAGSNRIPEGFNCLRTTSLCHLDGITYSVNQSAVDPAFERSGHPWQVLHFQHLDNGRSHLSYGAHFNKIQAAPTLPHSGIWLWLLPQATRPSGPPLADVRSSSDYAGLGGDVSALFGLIALDSSPQGDHVHQRLCETVDHNNESRSWHVRFDLDHLHPGLSNSRGLVVEVFARNEADLEEYERRPLLKSLHPFYDTTL